LRKKDRLAAGKYKVTGDLLGGTTGSIVMFANPIGSGALALNSTILATVNFELLAKEWQKPSVSDIVQAALNLVSERIEKYSLLVQTGKLQIKVFNKVVDLKHPEVMREIRESNPHTISWSNLSDYLHP
jgi:hypothetical protein